MPNLDGLTAYIHAILILEAAFFLGATPIVAFAHRQNPRFRHIALLAFAVWGMMALRLTTSLTLQPPPWTDVVALVCFTAGVVGLLLVMNLRGRP